MEKSERDICPPPNQMTTTAALLAFRVLYHTDIYTYIYSTCSVCIRGLFCVLTLKWAYKCVLENDDFFCRFSFCCCHCCRCSFSCFCCCLFCFFFLFLLCSFLFLWLLVRKFLQIIPNWWNRHCNYMYVSVCVRSRMQNTFFLVRQLYETPLNERNHIH